MCVLWGTKYCQVTAFNTFAHTHLYELLKHYLKPPQGRTHQSVTAPAWRTVETSMCACVCITEPMDQRTFLNRTTKRNIKKHMLLGEKERENTSDRYKKSESEQARESE